MRSLSILLLWFFTLSLFAQEQSDSLTTDAEPLGGINALALHYYKIDFSKAQRDSLKDVEIEFIYEVDPQGRATLAEINGIRNNSILDSLRKASETIPDFRPRVEEGQAVASLYFMQLVFPSYQMTKSRFGLLQGQAYREAKMDDFEYIHKSNNRLDILFGGMTNQFLGKPSAYLKLGGGMKMEINYSDKKRRFYGMQMNVYGNGLKKDFPIASSREQNSGPPTILVGATFGKWWDKFAIQLEINYAAQNITPKEGDNDPDWVQFEGWSPGILFHYPIRFGKESPLYYYGSPTLINHHVDLSFGLRPIFLSQKEATGLMIELGLSYRLTTHLVKEYKLKDEFIKELN